MSKYLWKCTLEHHSRHLMSFLIPVQIGFGFSLKCARIAQVTPRLVNKRVRPLTQILMDMLDICNMVQVEYMASCLKIPYAFLRPKVKI